MGVVSSIFYRLVDIISSPALEIGWRLRVEILRDVADKVFKLHKSGLAHNQLEDQVFLTVDGFRTAVGDEKGTVGIIKVAIFCIVLEEKCRAN